MTAHRKTQCLTHAATRLGGANLDAGAVAHGEQREHDEPDTDCETEYAVGVAPAHLGEHSVHERCDDEPGKTHTGERNPERDTTLGREPPRHELCDGNHADECSGESKQGIGQEVLPHDLDLAHQKQADSEASRADQKYAPNAELGRPASDEGRGNAVDRDIHGTRETERGATPALGGLDRIQEHAERGDAEAGAKEQAHEATGHRQPARQRAFYRRGTAGARGSGTG